MIKIVKGSISRFIEEHKLVEYKEKGFTVVVEEPIPEGITSEGSATSFEKMTTTELKDFAKDCDIDIAGTKNKAEILLKIFEWEKAGETDGEPGEAKKP